ncbi:N-acetylglucosamine-6-phosphate deacetylase [Salirhabdus sp. Marseille-P4669]|uniref:N-acetylglucosamine-6-phosphate deacetylase n=1 Tax=Salirhabdus sp. Marseille-P4669 TaxID=2042310 RepID=UPI000C7E59B1|nr:N-acetylglucosamine-6-phosphate deacetylase [Salirhabdus sp. Marseille-P4669]
MVQVSPILMERIKIYAENETIEEGYLLLENGKISKLLRDIPEKLPADVIRINGKHLNALPGFIDSHIHGANGADVMDGTEEALDAIASALPAEGTTSFLATTITQSPANIEKALENVATYPNKAGHAELIGIHLEGPFVEKSKAGAQPIEYIVKPDVEQFEKWQRLSANNIRTITMAPEHDEDGVFARTLHKSGVNVSAGHTGTNFHGMKKAVEHGVRQVTHLCNAMTGIHHLDIGVVGAAFQLQQLRAELITDGIHVSDDMLALIYKNIGSERLIMITDAMRAKGLDAGTYDLGGQSVRVSNGRAVLGDGTLAGSVLKMNEGAKRMLGIAGVTLENIVEMASVNPAKQIGFFERKGSIREGKDADIILVDDQMNIRYTICGGVISFRGG